MRILQLISSAKWTGAADPAVNLAKGLRLRGHEVYLGCIPGRSLSKQAMKLGIQPLYDFELNTNNPLTVIADIKNLNRFISARQLDILHLHLSHDHWLGALAAKCSGSGVKVVRTLHRLNKLRIDPIHKYLFKNLTDFTITLSAAARQKLIQAVGLSTNQVATIYGGVDEVRFNPKISGHAIRKRLGLVEDTPLIGLVSHLHENRGHKQALAAFPHIKKLAPEAKLIFLGETDEPYYSRLKKQVQDMGLTQDVKFVVDGNADEWPEHVAMLDVVMYLAPGSEDSARAVVEAMALGKPVVAIDVGAIPEIVAPEKTGLIIQDLQPQTIAGAVSYSLTHPNEAKKWGQAGRKQIEARFTNQLRAQHTEQVYVKLCQET